MSTQPVILRKEVAALPVILEPNTLYFVRVGTGFDTYLSDTTGAIAYKQNQPDCPDVRAPYYVPTGKTYLVPDLYPLPALIDITVDGFIKTDGFLLEATP